MSPNEKLFLGYPAKAKDAQELVTLLGPAAEADAKMSDEFIAAMKEQAREVAIAQAMAYPEPETLPQHIYIASETFNGALIWALVEGYIEVTEKGLRENFAELRYTPKVVELAKEPKDEPELKIAAGQYL